MGRASLRSKDFPSGDAGRHGHAHRPPDASSRFQHVSVGNPQCAIEVSEDLEELDLPALGRADRAPRAVSQPHQRLVLDARVRRHDPRADLRARGGGDDVLGHRRQRRRGGRRAARAGQPRDRAPGRRRAGGGRGGGPAHRPDRLGGARVHGRAQRRIPGGTEQQHEDERAAGPPAPVPVRGAVAQDRREEGRGRGRDQPRHRRSRHAHARAGDRRAGRRRARPRHAPVPVEQGPRGVPRGRGALLRAPLRRVAGPGDRDRAGAGRQGVHLQPQPGLPRPRHLGAGGRPRLPGLHRRAAAGGRRGGPDAAGARAGLRPRPRRDPGRGARARADDVPQLPQQPDRRGGARRAVRARGGVRPASTTC